MSFSEFFIKRPVLSVVLSLFLITTGVVSLYYLKTEFIPKFKQDHLRITASYVGAGAKLVESSVTTPLENAVLNLQGVDAINSRSYSGYCSIDIRLQEGVEAPHLIDKIRNQIAHTDLPENVKPRVRVVTLNIGDFMDISVANSSMKLPDLRDYLERNVVGELRLIPGVGDVNVVGASPYTVQVKIDPLKLSARHLTLDQVERAINENDESFPAGKIHTNNFDLFFNSITNIRTIKELKKLIISDQGEEKVSLKDIGKVVLVQNPDSISYAKVNGRSAIIIRVQTGYKANPVETSRLIKSYLQDVKSSLVPGTHLEVLYDQADFMKVSIGELYQSIYYSIIIVSMVIFLILGRFVSLMIPVITIPICLFSAFALMYFSNFTINLFTLLAIGISVGLVVDDAIVMLENIYRHIEMGKGRLLAAIKGSSEITFSIIAMTLTLTAVYVPLAFLSEKVSTVLRPFAFTLAGAVIISGIVSLTLSPVMCAYLLKPIKRKGYAQLVQRFFLFLANVYQNSLGYLLKFPFVAVIVLLFVTVLGGFLVARMPNSFFPDMDLGMVVARVVAPANASVGYHNVQTKKLDSLLGQYTDIENVFSIIGESPNLSWANLIDFNKRKRSSHEIVKTVSQELANIAGLNAWVWTPAYGETKAASVSFSILGSKSYAQLYKIAQRVIEQLKTYSGLRGIRSSLVYNSREYDVSINKERAAELGVNSSQIQQAINIYIHGNKLSPISLDGKHYDVWLRGANDTYQGLRDLEQIDVLSKTGKLVKLAELISVKPVLSFDMLSHHDRRRSVEISATISSGYNLANVVQHLERILPDILPIDTYYTFHGRARNAVSSRHSMVLVFILGLVFIYLVLAAQFESFLDPLVILFSVPLSVIVAVLFLRLFGASFTVFSLIGILTLVGLLAKNGILITQFANVLQSQGETLIKAVVKASGTRLRPILMTSLAMVSGIVPLLFFKGEAAVCQHQVATVLIFGLIFGTLFSMILVPVGYCCLYQLKTWFRS